MRRKRKDDREQWRYRVYLYGATLGDLAPPQRWPEPLARVVYAQRDLWNACHAAWEANRAAYEALMQASEPLVALQEVRDSALTSVKSLETHIKGQRQQARKRAYPDADTDAAALGAARTAWRQATQHLKDAQALYRIEIQPQLSGMLETLWKDVHVLGQASPLAWYNERQVTDAFRNAVERFLKRQGGPPHPKHFPQQAHLTYHFTGPPLAWEVFLAGKSSMITFGDFDERLPTERCGWDPAIIRSRRLRLAHLRISDRDTLSFGVWVHRQPPAGSLVKGVELVGREKSRGWKHHLPLWEWTFLVLCEIPPALAPEGDLAPCSESRVEDARALAGDPASSAFTLPRPRQEGDLASDLMDDAPAPEGDAAPKKTAALDLNWRIMDDERIRVGMVYDGVTCTPLYFPAKLVARWRYAQDLQQGLAALMEGCKADLTALWAQDPLPPDLDPRGAGWAQTGQGGLLRLLRAVDRLPSVLPARQPTWEVLHRWSLHAGSRWREWRGVSNHLDRAKVAWYCIVAKHLCSQYGAIAIEKLSFKRMAEAPDQAPRLAQAQKYRQLVGLGALLLRLTHTAEREGVTLETVNPAHTSRTCPHCGTVLSQEQWAPQAGEQFIQCPHGHRYDVDEGAARVIWQRAFGGAQRSAAD